jgi:hypothetical protein
MPPCTPPPAALDSIPCKSFTTMRRYEASGLEVVASVDVPAVMAFF